MNIAFRIPLWLFNIAMEHGPTIDDKNFKNDDLPYLFTY